jgi:hypothetical protein
MNLKIEGIIEGAARIRQKIATKQRSKPKK